MSPPVPKQRRAPDAAPGQESSASSAGRSLPAFPQHGARAAAPAHSPIEREIERSQRASAALAATRALARASFTDSQLAADETNPAAAAESGSDDGWIRTEYASLDQSVRAPQDDVPHAGPAANLVGGGFTPGLAFQHVRAFPGPSIAQAPIQTRSGARARFLTESRLTPRAERLPGTGPRHDSPTPNGAGPQVGTAAGPVAAPASRSPMGHAAGRTSAAGAPRGPLRVALTAGLAAVVVLVGGSVAWKSGRLADGRPAPPSLAAAPTGAGADADTARLSSAAMDEITLAPPAAGLPSGRTSAEVDAALAAAARAAAVPLASVQAAGPARVARPVPAVALVARTPAVGASPTTRGKDDRHRVSAAVAHAQARADGFLATEHPAAEAAESGTHD